MLAYLDSIKDGRKALRPHLKVCGTQRESDVTISSFVMQVTIHWEDSCLFLDNAEQSTAEVSTDVIPDPLCQGATGNASEPLLDVAEINLAGITRQITCTLHNVGGGEDWKRCTPHYSANRHNSFQVNITILDEQKPKWRTARKICRQ